jgi:hypothetical protein
MDIPACHAEVPMIIANFVYKIKPKIMTGLELRQEFEQALARAVTMAEHVQWCQNQVRNLENLGQPGLRFLPGIDSNHRLYQQWYEQLPQAEEEV